MDFTSEISSPCWALAGWHRGVSAGWARGYRTRWLVKHEIPLVERRRTPRPAQDTRQEARRASTTSARFHSRGVWRYGISSHCADFSDRGLLGGYRRSRRRPPDVCNQSHQNQRTHVSTAANGFLCGRRYVSASEFKKSAPRRLAAERAKRLLFLLTVTERLFRSYFSRMLTG